MPNQRVVWTLPGGERVSYEEYYGGYTNGIYNQDYGDFAVQYDVDLALLYIRIPEMSYADADSALYSPLLAHRGKPIRKVVIDVRGNPGGGDYVWLELMARLLPERVPMRTVAATTVANLTRHLPEATMKPVVERIEHPFLMDEPQICRYPFMCDTIGHSPESLNVQAPIYLLEDDRSYSSSLAFMVAARQIPGMKSVGQRSGWFGGRGVDLLVFVLPHSKIAFQLEPIVDMTGVKTEEDILQDRPDIKIPLEVEEISRHMFYRGRR